MGLYDRLSMFYPKGERLFTHLQDEKLDHQTRILKYRKFWDFYGGRQWTYPKQENVPQVTVNYCRAFVNKFTAFLFQSGFKFIFEDKDEEKDVLPYLRRIWDVDNNRHSTSYKIAQTGGVCGDVYVYVTLDEFDEEGNVVPVDQRKVKIIPWNPMNVIPEWDPNDYTRMQKVTLFYERYTPTQEKVVLYQMVITRKEVREYEDGAELTAKRRKNLLGVIPVVHISNLIDAASPYGVSDLEDVLELNKEYNEKATDVSDVLDYLGQPVVVVKGANANKIKGTGRIWAGLPVNASVDILNLNAPMSSSVDYLKMLKQGMHEVSGVPEASLGQMQPISNTSGVALHIQYLPLMEKIWMKKMTYGEGLVKITELALRYLEVRDLIPEDILDKMAVRYQAKIEFNDPLPKDKVAQMNLLATKMEAGLASKHSAMRDLGQEDSERIFKEIEEEKKADIEFLYNTQGKLTTVQDNEVKGAGPSGFESDTGVHKRDEEGDEVGDEV